MNTAKIEALKQVAGVAQTAYEVEQAHLVALGLNSKARYPLLKTLKTEADVTAKVYRDFAHGQINKELCAIIASGKPARDAAARARSPWKQAKFDAAQAAQ